MYLIDETYFQRDLQIPNSKGRTADGQPTTIEQLIDGKSRLYLRNALGLELFNELDTHIVNGVLDSNAPQKWLDFVNGKEYQLDDVNYKWNGVLTKEGAFKTSILSYYVYYYYLLDQVSQSTGIGEVIALGKNTVRVNPTQKIVNVWNKFLELNQKEISNMPNYSFIRGVEFIDWCGGDNNYTDVSLVKYLRDFDTVYPNATCKTYKVKNQFGL